MKEDLQSTFSLMTLLTCGVVLGMAGTYIHLASKERVGDRKVQHSSLSREAKASLLRDRKEGATAFKLFEEHLKQYRDGVGALASNLFYQFIFVLLTYLVVVRNPDKIKIPATEIEVPNTGAMSLVSCACMGFLWLKFGFQANAIIDERLRLHQLGTLVDNGVAMGPQAAASDGAESASILSLLEDGGIFDSWVRLYTPLEWQSIDGVGASVILVITFLFLGLSNGCMLSLAWRAYQESRKEARDNEAHLRLWIFGLVWLFLLITHGSLFWAKHNANAVQLIALIITAVIAHSARKWVGAIPPSGLWGVQY